VPKVVVPTYDDGQKETPTDYDCSDTTYTYAGISYTAGSLKWDPVLPTKFGVGNVPSFTSQAYVIVTSSDTANCSSPGRVDIGSAVTWTVADKTDRAKFSWSCNGNSLVAAFNQTLNIFKQDPLLCRVDQPPAMSGQITGTYHQECCNGTPTDVTVIGGGVSLDFGKDSCDFPLVGIPFLITGNVWVSDTLKVDITGDGKIACDQLTYCGKVKVALTLTGTAGISVIASSLLSIQVGIQASAGGDGEVCFNVNGFDHGKAHLCVNSVNAVCVFTFLGSTTTGTYPLGGPWCSPDLSL
jgi:hypothetical protein